MRVKVSFNAHVKNLEYVDFLLVEAPLESVGRAIQEGQTQQAECAANPPVEPVRPGFFLRFLMRIMGLRNAPPPDEMFEPADGEIHRDQSALAISRDGVWPGTPIGRASGREHATANGVYDSGDLEAIRLSTPPTLSGWTLVECFDMVSGMSMHGFQLSMAMPGQDILYFRLPGPNAHEPHYDFHLYRDGNTERRVLCHCTVPTGTPPSPPWWEGIADGPATRYEHEDDYRGATEATLLDTQKIQAILGRLNTSLDALFDPGPRPAMLVSRGA